MNRHISDFGSGVALAVDERDLALFYFEIRCKKSDAFLFDFFFGRRRVQLGKIRSSLFVQLDPDTWTYYFDLGDLNSLVQIRDHRELGREALDRAERATVTVVWRQASSSAWPVEHSENRVQG